MRTHTPPHVVLLPLRYSSCQNVFTFCALISSQSSLIFDTCLCAYHSCLLACFIASLLLHNILHCFHFVLPITYQSNFWTDAVPLSAASLSLSDHLLSALLFRWLIFVTTYILYSSTIHSYTHLLLFCGGQCVRVCGISQLVGIVLTTRMFRLDNKQ